MKLAEQISKIKFEKSIIYSKFNLVANAIEPIVSLAEFKANSKENKTTFERR
jgi:hypothetical protein